MIAKVGNFKIALEVADSPSKMIKGLSGRKSLNKGSGMLFTFNNLNPSIQTRHMNFPLDLVFIKRNGIVSDVITANPGEEVYEGEGMYVMELNKGEAKNNGIEKGVKISFKKEMNKPRIKRNTRTKSIIRSRVKPTKYKKGGSNDGKLDILDSNGDVQKTIPVSSRIISRKETKKLLELAGKTPSDKNSIELGKFMVKVINGQDKRPAEYVEE